MMNLLWRQMEKTSGGKVKDFVKNHLLNHENG
jgi:hypothetical protein